MIGLIDHQVRCQRGDASPTRAALSGYLEAFRRDDSAMVLELCRRMPTERTVFPPDSSALWRASAGANLVVDQPDHPLAAWSEGNALPPPSVD